MPREAPVTRAIREARGWGIEGALSSSSRRRPGPIRRGGYGVKVLVVNSVRKTRASGYGSRPSPGRQLTRFRQQRQLPRLRLDLGLVGEMGRIDAGEAMVGEFRIGGIAAGLAHCAVHAVDRQERQCIRADGL